MTIYRFEAISIGLIFSVVMDRACPKFSGQYVIGNMRLQLYFGCHANLGFHFIRTMRGSRKIYVPPRITMGNFCMREELALGPHATAPNVSSQPN